MKPLIGHDAGVAEFRAAARDGRLHHAWLLGGPQGIGKARFADAAALYLLAGAVGSLAAGERFDVPASAASAQLMAAGSHPDFARLERQTNDKGELGRSIRIEQVRALQRLFATTPSLSPRRVVVVDAVDDLERGGANALLKSLEEPPAGTVFLLVSHAPGRLLPTIRSRCRLMRLSPLSDGDTAAALRIELPETTQEEIAGLVAVAGGAPGTALRFAGLDVAGLDTAMDRLVRHGDPTNALRGALARALALKAAQPRYEVFLERVPTRIAAEARRRTGRAAMEAIALWDEARRIAEGAVRLSLEPQVTTFELAGLLARLAPASATAKA